MNPDPKKESRVPIAVQLEHWIENGPVEYGSIMLPTETASEVLAALQQAEADKRDAQRYRWLRDAEYDPSVLEILIAPGIHRNFVDAQIDAALTGTGNQT